MTEETNNTENLNTTLNQNEVPVESPLEMQTEDIAQINQKKTIGQLIKQKRDEKNLSLKVISQQTKIHISLLEQLEADNITKLPSKAYVLGFVKSTAKILGITQSEAIEALEYTYNPSTAKKSAFAAKSISNTHLTSKNDFNQGPSEGSMLMKSFISEYGATLAKAAVSIIVLGTVGFYITNYISNIESEKTHLPEVVTRLDQIDKNSNNPALDHQAAQMEKAEEMAQTPTTPATTETLTTDATATAALEAKTEIKNLKEVKLTNFSTKEHQFEELDLTTEAYSELLPTRFRVDSAGGIHSVFLNANHGDSWVTYKVDDKNIKKFVLRQGRTLFIRGKLVRLFLGNGNNLTVFYNNKPVKLAQSGSKSIRNIVLPEENKTNYSSPLFVFQDDGTVMTSDEYKMLMEKQNSNVVTPAPPKAAADYKAPASTTRL